MPPFIAESSASGEEVETIIRERLIPAVADLTQSQILISLLSFQLCLMKPDLTAEELKSGVREVSQFMCLFLSSTVMADSIDATDKTKVN